MRTRTYFLIFVPFCILAFVLAFSFCLLAMLASDRGFFASSRMGKSRCGPKSYISPSCYIQKEFGTPRKSWVVRTRLTRCVTISSWEGVCAPLNCLTALSIMWILPLSLKTQKRSENRPTILTCQFLTQAYLRGKSWFQRFPDWIRARPMSIALKVMAGRACLHWPCYQRKVVFTPLRRGFPS